jgi:hypothetical protein
MLVTRTECSDDYSERFFFDRSPAVASLRKCLKAIKRRLTLFLPPNHGFGESFCGSDQDSPHKFSAHAEPFSAQAEP